MNNRLRVLRAERGWTQGELAERAGDSRQMINVIETGNYDPSMPLEFALARLFEARIEDVFIPDGNSGQGA